MDVHLRIISLFPRKHCIAPFVHTRDVDLHLARASIAQDIGRKDDDPQLFS